MKNLVNDVLSIFTPQSVEPVFIRAGLTPQEKSAVHPFGITTVSWATSMEELNDALLHKALDAGAVAYHITDVDAHKPGNDEPSLLTATATLYTIDEKGVPTLL